MNKNTFGKSQASVHLYEELKKVNDKKLTRKVSNLLRESSEDMNALYRIHNMNTRVRFLKLLKSYSINKAKELTGDNQTVSNFLLNVLTARFRQCFAQADKIRRVQKADQQRKSALLKTNGNN